MNRLVLFLSFIAVATLFALGLFAPTNPAIWLASTSLNFAAIRLVLMVAFGLLFLTAPPRAPFLRKAIGMLVIGVAVFTLKSTYLNQMKFLDSLMLLEFCIAAGLAVLERTGEEIVYVVKGRSTVHNKHVVA